MPVNWIGVFIHPYLFLHIKYTYVDFLKKYATLCAQ